MGQKWTQLPFSILLPQRVLLLADQKSLPTQIVFTDLGPEQQHVQLEYSDQGAHVEDDEVEDDEDEMCTTTPKMFSSLPTTVLRVLQLECQVLALLRTCTASSS